MTPQQERQIKQIFHEYLAELFSRINKLKLEKLQINTPFLLLIGKQLQWQDTQDASNYLIEETFQRGVTTSAGFKIEKIAKEIFGQPTAIEGVDFELTKSHPEGGTDIYYFQVKAGPNTIDGPHQKAIERSFNYALRRNPRAIPIIGITYGDKSKANSFTKRLMERFQILFEKEFWSFISGDENCWDRICQIAKDVAITFRPSSGKTLNDALNEKKQEISQNPLLREIFKE